MIFEFSMGGKRLDLLRQIAPSLTRASVLRTTQGSGTSQFAAVQTAASSLRVEVNPIDMRDVAQIEAAVATFARAPNGGLIVTGTLAAVRNSKGEVGIIFDEAPEAKAFDRWQRGQFREVEREFAARYRRLLSASDHGATAKLAKQMLSIHDAPRNLGEALAIAKDVVHGTDQRFLTLKTVFFLLGGRFSKVQERWVRLGRPRLPEFAPYAAHCLLVDVFFYIAVDKKLISPDRPSNRIDIAYLYYLPFAMMFISNDKLHRRVAPLFMSDDQVFVGGDELKRDLAALDAYFWSRPQEEREQGLFRLAGYPPDDDHFLTARIWRQLKMRTQRSEEDVEPGQLTSMPGAAQALAMVREMRGAAKAEVGSFTKNEIR